MIAIRFNLSRIILSYFMFHFYLLLTQLKVAVPQIIYDKFSDIPFDKIIRPLILIFCNLYPL